MKRPYKANNLNVTEALLYNRTKYSESLGYGKQKWIIFCEKMLEHGCNMTLYEAKGTLSKYIMVRRDGKEFKVRFSNHKPNQEKELGGDCDFFVGVTHTGVRTTEDAIKAAINFFES